MRWLKPKSCSVEMTHIAQIKTSSSALAENAALNLAIQSRLSSGGVPVRFPEEHMGGGHV